MACFVFILEAFNLTERAYHNSFSFCVCLCSRLYQTDVTVVMDLTKKNYGSDGLKF